MIEQTRAPQITRDQIDALIDAARTTDEPQTLGPVTVTGFTERLPFPRLPRRAFWLYWQGVPVGVSHIEAVIACRVLHYVEHPALTPEPREETRDDLWPDQRDGLIDDAPGGIPAW